MAAGNAGSTDFFCARLTFARSFVFAVRVSQNHYQVLGVPATAPAAEIKRAYRQLAVRYHPDKHGGDTRYEDQFKAVALAYGVLSDPGRRATSDFQLAQAARRLDEQRRAQQFRPAQQHVYGVPMPPPAPLRTRPPAASHERHYQRIPRPPARFTRRDWATTVLLLGGILLFVFSVKAGMDRLSARSHYADGLRAYAHGQLDAAYTFMEESLSYRPSYGPALRRRGELELLVNHDADAARADLTAALRQLQPRRVAAGLHDRLGRCETALAHPAAAERHLSRALALDSTLAAAYLARGEARLLDQHRPAAALADLTQGLRQWRQPQLPVRYLQVRGVALAALGRYPAARADYFRILQAYPQEPRTHFLLGCLAARAGDSAAACAYYGRAVALGYAKARALQRRCP